MTQWLTSNEKIITFGFNILQTITIPFVLFWLNQQNKKRKEIEQQRKEELAMLNEFSKTNIIPLVQEFDTKARDKQTLNDPNLLTNLTSGVIHEFGGFLPLFTTWDNDTYRRYGTTMKILEIIHHRLQDKTIPIDIVQNILNDYLYTIKNLPYTLTQDIFWKTMIYRNITNLKNSELKIEYINFLSPQDILFNELVRTHNDK